MCCVAATVIWLLRRGYQYLADPITVVPAKAGTILLSLLPLAAPEHNGFRLSPE
jgi:hypothetical protein